MDDFDELMAECEIGDFSGFVLSDEEIKQAKKERKEQVESKVKELRELMAKAEQLEKEGKRLSNTDARKLKNLASDQLVVIAAMEDDVDIEELVDMENGDIKEERESGPSPVEMMVALELDVPKLHLNQLLRKKKPTTNGKTASLLLLSVLPKSSGNLINILMIHIHLKMLIFVKHSKKSEFLKLLNLYMK